MIAQSEVSPRRLAAAGALGAIAAIVMAWTVSGSSVVQDAHAAAVWRSMFILSYVAAGIVIWRMRPAASIGPALVGLGLLYAPTSLIASSRPWLYATGRVFLAVFVVAGSLVFAAYPSDAATKLLHSRAALVVLIGLLVAWVADLLCASGLPAGGAFSDCRSTCPANPVRALSVPGAVADRLGALVTGLTAALLGIVAVTLYRELREPGRFRSRLFGPPLTAIIGLLASYVVYSALRQAEGAQLGAARVTTAAFGLAVPASMVIGQIWATSDATRSLMEMASRVDVRPTQDGLEEFVRRALGEPKLRLGVWDPARGLYIDATGAPIGGAERRKRRSDMTFVDRMGGPCAVLVHDPALRVLSPLPETLGVAAMLLLEHERMVKDLQHSRARIAAAAQHARLHMERDIHDGLQQRLVALQLTLARARELARDRQMQAALDAAAHEAVQATDELRELAQGLYPAVLRERGVADGLRATLGVRSSVEVDDAGVGRQQPLVEEALYFAALESINNAQKHGHAVTSIRVELAREGSGVVLLVTDDGPGFDVSRRGAGIGLTSIRDRVESVGGEVEIRSHPGAGTVVRLRVPIRPDDPAGEPGDAG